MRKITGLVLCTALLQFSCEGPLSPPEAPSPPPGDSGPGPAPGPGPVPDPVPNYDFSMELSDEEISRALVLYYHGFAEVQMTFRPVDPNAHFNWVDLMFWLKKPGQSKVLVWYNGSEVLAGPGNSHPGGSVRMAPLLTNLNQPLHRWSTWQQGYTQLIVRAHGAVSFEDGDTEVITKERTIELVQDAPAMDGQSYKISIDLYNDLSTDPDDTSYTSWRHWLQVDTDYPGGPPSYATPKIAFGGMGGIPSNSSYSSLTLFRPANVSPGESVTVFIDKDGDDSPDIEWKLTPSLLPLSVNNNFRWVICHFGTEGQVDPVPEIF